MGVKCFSTVFTHWGHLLTLRVKDRMGLQGHLGQSLQLIDEDCEIHREEIECPKFLRPGD